MITGLGLGITASANFTAAAAGRTAMTVNNVGVSFITSPKQFGSHAGQWEASESDYLALQSSNWPSAPDLSGEFTLECFVNVDDVSANKKLFDFRGLNAGTYDDNNPLALGSTLLVDVSGSSFRCFVDGGDRATLTSGEFSTGTWKHVAVQRDSSNVVNAWVDGTRAVNYSGATDDYSAIFTRNQGIGVNGDGGGLTNFMHGQIDEIRFSTVARYATGSSITVPTSAFENDADTFLLLHLDNNVTDDVG